jgi:hypothetical protein
MNPQTMIRRAAATALGSVMFWMSLVAAEAPNMTVKQIRQTVVGNTIKYQFGNDTVFEYYAKDGTIRGVLKPDAKFTGHWTIRDDATMCFVHDDPNQSGCVYVAKLPGKRGKLEFHRIDGVVEGPFELIPGNPEKL